MSKPLWTLRIVKMQTQYFLNDVRVFPTEQERLWDSVYGHRYTRKRAGEIVHNIVMPANTK